MKILLVGEFYSENLGDPLLCQTVEQVIRERFPQAQIIPFDMSGKISATEYYQPKTDPKMDALTKFVCGRYLYYRRAAICRAYDRDKERCLRVWYRLKELRKQHRFDLVIFAGGSLIMDYFAGVVNLILRQFAFSRTKILFHACGMSTLDEDSEYLFRQVLGSEKVCSISLRDSYGRFHELFNTNARVMKTYDTALCCSRYYQPVPAPRIQLGIGLIDRCYDRQIALLRQLLESDVQWKAFTNGSPYDQDYARQLLLDVGVPAEKIREYLLPRPETTDQLIQMVTGFSGIIAFRMHSQIIAASFGVPSFGLVWDDKILAFYEKLGYPQGCTREIPKLEEILKRLNSYDRKLRQRALDQGEESCRCLENAIRCACNIN